MDDGDATLSDRLRLLESCVRGIVMEFDEAGRYLEVWTHDPALLARPRAELLRSTINEVLGVETGAQFMDMIRRARTERQPVRLEYPLTVLGGPRWFAAEAFPGARPGTAVLLVQDITERKQMEARLLESDRLAAIGLLAGGLGHEINNPLAWVMTQLNNLHTELSERAKEGGPEFARWAQQLAEALEGSDRIRQIVRDLAFFTRSPETESTTFELGRALRPLVASLASGSVVDSPTRSWRRARSRRTSRRSRSAFRTGSRSSWARTGMGQFEKGSESPRSSPRPWLAVVTEAVWRSKGRSRPLPASSFVGRTWGRSWLVRPWGCAGGCSP